MFFVRNAVSEPLQIVSVKFLPRLVWIGGGEGAADGAEYLMVSRAMPEAGWTVSVLVPQRAGTCSALPSAAQLSQPVRRVRTLGLRILPSAMQG